MSLLLTDMQDQNVMGEDVFALEHSTEEDVSRKIKEQLLILWEFYLDKEALCMSDHFVELGGQSLEAVQLVTHINRIFNLKISANDLFDNPTVELMSGYVFDLLNGQAVYEYESDQLFLNSNPSDKLLLPSEQQKLIHSNRLSLGNNVHQIYFNIVGNVGLDSMENALTALVEHHDALKIRLRFDEKDRVWALFGGSIQPQINIHEVGALHEDTICPEIFKIIENFSEFSKEELSKQPYRFVVFHSKNSVLLQFVFIGHRCLFDESIHESFVRSLNEALYHVSGIELGKADNLTYYDYLNSFHTAQAKELIEKNNAYWLEVFQRAKNLRDDGHKGYDEREISENKHLTVGYNSFRVDLSLDVLNLLNKRGAENQSTLYMVVLAIYSYVYSLFNQKQTLLLGVETSNRSFMGRSSSLIALLLDVDVSLPFKNYLVYVRESLLTAMEHKLFSWEEVCEKTGLNYCQDKMLDTAFNFYDCRNLLKKVGGYELSVLPIEPKKLLSDFDVNVYWSNKEATLEVVYDTQQCTEDFAEQFAQSVETVIRGVSLDFSKPLCAFPLLGDTELERLQSQQWNSYQPLDLTKNIVDLVFLQARKIKDLPAVYFNDSQDDSYSYSDLCHLVSAVSYFLSEQGINKGQVVALSLEKNEVLPIFILAIWDIGATITLLDARAKASDVHYQLRHSEASYLIVDNSHENVDSSLDIKKIKTPAMVDFILSPSKRLRVSSDQALIIYKNHSDYDKPLAVTIPHYALSNVFQSLVSSLGLSRNCRALSLAPLHEITVIFDIFLPLISGGALWLDLNICYTTLDDDRLESDGALLTDDALLKKVENLDINFLYGTPETWSYFEMAMWQGRSDFVAVIETNQDSLFSTDIINKKVNHLCEFLKNRVGTLWHMFGEVESSGPALIQNLTDRFSLASFDVCVANAHTYILNQFGEPMPFGVAGNLYIGGRGVAHGYHQRERLTDKEMVFDPWALGGRMFNARQIAKSDDSGRVFFLKPSVMTNSPLDVKRNKKPSKDTEFYIADLWMLLLDLEYVDRTDNFMTLGAYPSLVDQFIKTVQDEMMVDLSRELVTQLNLAELASEIDVKLLSKT